MRPVIAAIKILAFGLLSLPTIALQWLVLKLCPYNRFFYVIPMIFQKAACFIFRLNVRVVGTPLKSRRAVYVSNHLSYIDIPVIGSILSASFISKAEVRKWPIIGDLAYVGDTIFIKRTRSAAEQSLRDIKEALLKGRSLTLFPEGTSTSGQQVLPFKSTIFDLFLSDELKDKVTIQPFTVTLMKSNGKKPETIEDFDLYAWYGNMDFEPHFWKLAKSKGVDILLTFHDPVLARDYDDRKVFAKDCEQVIAKELENTLA